MNQREQRPTRSGTLTENPAGASTDMVSAATVTGQEARRRRDRIKLLLTSMTEQTNKVVAILEEAQTNEDHLALGYASWTAYIAGEYAGLLAELTRANRREVVGSLTSAGMPTRAIAEIVGVDHSTVVRDQKQVVQGAPPDREDSADREVDRRVTGRDGKSYPVPSKPVVEPKKPRRSSLPDQYWHAMYDLDKALRRLEKLHADDRFAANRETLRDLHIKGLVRGHDALYDMVLQLANLHSTEVAESVDLVKPKFGWTQ
jgi:hypothetical protein